MYGFRRMIVMSKINDIYKLLSDGERVTLECKKASKGVPNSLWDTFRGFCQHIRWNHSVGCGRAYGRAIQYQAV